MQASGHNYNFYNRVAVVKVIPLSGVWTFSQKIIDSLFSIRRNYHRMWRRLSYFLREKSTRKRFGLSSLWKVRICPNIRMEESEHRSGNVCWSRIDQRYPTCIFHRLNRNVGSRLERTIIYRNPKIPDNLQCPPEREKAIWETLKYFGMI